MKKIVITSLMILTLTFISFAQAPQAFKYQAVARNAVGNELINTAINVRASIRDISATGTILYQETFSVTTNMLGLFSINIGQGTIVTGLFTTIPWSTGSKYIQQEVDFGSGYQNMGTSELLSVPYALYSANGTTGPIGLTGPAGTNGATGAIGPIGLTGASGTNGATGATGLPGTNGTNGTNGATGAIGPIGLTGASGTNGATGATGLPGTNGTNGTNGATGAIGPIGLTGASGTNGATGATGLPGTNGTNGATGATGPIGLTGAPGSALAFADFFALMPGDNAATIAVSAAIQFPQTGSTNGSGITAIGGPLFTQFKLAAIGIYMVNWQVSVNEPGQLVIGLNGIELPATVVGRAAGTTQIVGMRLITTTIANSVLSIVNPTGNSTALTITPSAGGANPVSASLVILRLQ